MTVLYGLPEEFVSATAEDICCKHGLLYIGIISVQIYNNMLVTRNKPSSEINLQTAVFLRS
jgi:hypothetical protein